MTIKRISRQRPTTSDNGTMTVTMLVVVVVVVVCSLVHAMLQLVPEFLGCVQGSMTINQSGDRLRVTMATTTMLVVVVVVVVLCVSHACHAPLHVPEFLAGFYKVKLFSCVEAA